jgi:hypothetical protein
MAPVANRHDRASDPTEALGYPKDYSETTATPVVGGLFLHPPSKKTPTQNDLEEGVNQR